MRKEQSSFDAAPRDATTELIRRVREGDRVAENEIASRNLPALRRWARGKLPAAARDMGDTQDLVQDTFMRVLRHVPTFDSSTPGGFQRYLRVTLKNRIKDEIRRVVRHPVPGPIDEALDQGPSPFQAAASNEARELCLSALGRLRPNDRALIKARVEKGWDYATIARAFNKRTPDAARVAVNRAIERLRQELLSAAPAQSL